MKHAFLFGFPRSGTTLLSGMLNSHSQICSTPETQFFSQTLRLNRFRMGRYASNRLKSIYLQTRLKDLQIEINRVDELSQQSNGSIIAFYNLLLLEYSNKKIGCRLIVEKTPDHIRFIDRIREHYSEAKLIAIVRDPRAAISSLLQTPWNRRSIKTAALEFDYEMRLLEKHKKTVFILKYEDLVNSPTKTLSACCTELDCSYEPEMIENRGGGEVVPDWESAWKENSKSPTKKDSLEKWRKNLLDSEIEFIEKTNRFALEKYNYAPIASVPLKATIPSEILRNIYAIARKLKTYKDKLRP